MNRIIIGSIIAVLVVGAIIGITYLLFTNKGTFEYMKKLNSSYSQDRQNMDNDIRNLQQISNKSLTDYSKNLEKMRQDLLTR
ncbi:MAG TPA: hypothetical protein VJ729_16605 [Nitrososphaeraceae archaeon]|nr:hypothetical protein [Nitrososphaeraceae archaeon]